MSFQAMTWAVEQNLPTYQKMVLIMLANRTNNDSGLCFPSHSLLAKECGMTRRSVIEQINKLEEFGLLSVVRNKSGNDLNIVNQYRLNLGANFDEKPRSQGSEPRSQSSEPRSQGSEPGSQGSEPRSQGSEQRSQGVVNQVHRGSEPGSQGVVNQVHTNQEYINQEINQESFNQEVNPVTQPPKPDQQENKFYFVIEQVLPWYKSEGFTEDINLHFKYFMKRLFTFKTMPRDVAAVFKKAIIDDWASLRKPVDLIELPEWARMPDDVKQLWPWLQKNGYPKSLGKVYESELRKILKHEVDLRMEMYLDYGRDVYPERRRL